MKDKILAFVNANKEMTYLWGSLVGFVILFSTLGLFLLFGAKSNFVQVDVMKTSLTGIRRFQQQHSDIGAYRGELESKFNRLDEQLPKNLDVNNLLLQINSLATMGNVKIDNLTILPEAPATRKSAYKSNRLQIVCIGQCQQLLDFMKAVEHEENLMLFSDVVMESKENDRVSLSAVITYYTR